MRHVKFVQRGRVDRRGGTGSTTKLFNAGGGTNTACGVSHPSNQVIEAGLANPQLAMFLLERRYAANNCWNGGWNWWRRMTWKGVSFCALQTWRPGESVNRMGRTRCH